MDLTISYYNDTLNIMDKDIYESEIGEGDDEQVESMAESPCASLLGTVTGVNALLTKINARSRLLFVYSCGHYGHGFM
jgi:hypothetical protein